MIMLLFLSYQVTITETGDDGQDVTSVIHVPSCPSTPLSTSLHRLSFSLHQANPASLPPSILSSVTSLLTSTTSIYLAISSNKLTQNIALQLTFDIHYILLLLVSRDLKETHGQTLLSVIDR